MDLLTKWIERGIQTFTSQNNCNNNHWTPLNKDSCINYLKYRKTIVSLREALVKNVKQNIFQVMTAAQAKECEEHETKNVWKSSIFRLSLIAFMIQPLTIFLEDEIKNKHKSKYFSSTGLWACFTNAGKGLQYSSKHALECYKNPTILKPFYLFFEQSSYEFCLQRIGKLNSIKYGAKQ